MRRERRKRIDSLSSFLPSLSISTSIFSLFAALRSLSLSLSPLSLFPSLSSLLSPFLSFSSLSRLSLVFISLSLSLLSLSQLPRERESERESEERERERRERMWTPSCICMENPFWEPRFHFEVMNKYSPKHPAKHSEYGLPLSFTHNVVSRAFQSYLMIKMN